MNDLKTYDSTTDFTLYISFHVAPGVVFDDSAVKISKIVEQEFSEDQHLCYSSVDEREMIYEIKRPIVNDNIQMGQFFQRLSNIFISLSSFHPHFTQYQEGGGNG